MTNNTSFDVKLSPLGGPGTIGGASPFCPLLEQVRLGLEIGSQFGASVEAKALNHGISVFIRGVKALIQGVNALIRGVKALIQRVRALIQTINALIRGDDALTCGDEPWVRDACR